jgi:hypothetical protein
MTRLPRFAFGGRPRAPLLALDADDRPSDR